jgi:osmotically inducible protein OsmC
MSIQYQGVVMSDKTASVHWEGRGKQGAGKISTQTEALRSYPYGYGSRFEDDRRGTNPEELLAAAHAACFTMAFSFACDAGGFATSAVDTTASVRLTMKDKGFVIDRINLRLEATMAGIDESTFQRIAATAKRECPLSKALAGVPEITLTAVLRN